MRAGLELRGEGVQWRVGEVGASYDHSRSVLVGDWNVPEERGYAGCGARGVRCERIGGRDVCTGDPYRIGAFRLALSRLGRAWEQGVRTAVVDAAPERVRALWRRWGSLTGCGCSRCRAQVVCGRSFGVRCRGRSAGASGERERLCDQASAPGGGGGCRGSACGVGVPWRGGAVFGAGACGECGAGPSRSGAADRGA